MLKYQTLNMQVKLRTYHVAAPFHFYFNYCSENGGKVVQITEQPQFSVTVKVNNLP